MRLDEVIRILEEIAPPEYAIPEDSIGLQVGDPDQDVRNILVTVDVTPGVVEEAARRKADLIVSHHPVISAKYEPLSSIRTDVYPQTLLYSLIKAGIGLYVMHTNFDSADGGINDALADVLGIVDTQVLEPTYTTKMFKLAVFVPEEAVDAVRSAMSEAGAGSIGVYTDCSFQTPGTGTFKPLPGAKPYTGEVGELEVAEEFRLEMLVPEDRLHEAISAMIAAHPYEEAAYDVYPLWNRGEEFGLGRLGRLEQPKDFGAFCEMVADVLGTEDLRVAGDADAMIEKVAILGGGGGSKIEVAYSKGVDVYITGDMGHHQMLKAKALGLNVIDATHFWTERPGMIALAPKLQLLVPSAVQVEYVDDYTLRES